MPTYDYSCSKCGKTFEYFQSMKDDPIKTCPEAQCTETPWGQGEVKRLLGTGAGLIFKGSGFYITDYRSDSYQQAAKKESGASTAAASAPSTPTSGASSTGGGSSGGGNSGGGSSSSPTSGGSGGSGA